MTRKRAIEIVVETVKKCSWVPTKWGYCGVKKPKLKEWGEGYSVGFSIFTASSVLMVNGVEKRPDDGYDFTRKWLEEHGHLKGDSDGKGE